MHARPSRARKLIGVFMWLQHKSKKMKLFLTVTLPSLVKGVCWFECKQYCKTTCFSGSFHSRRINQSLTCMLHAAFINKCSKEESLWCNFKWNPWALDTGCGCTCSLKFRMICLRSEIPLSLFRLPLLLLYLFLFKWHQLRRTECSNVYGIKHIQTCFFSSNYKIRMAISQSFSQPARKRCASKFCSGWGFFPNPCLDSCSLIPDIFFFFKRSAGNEQSQT